MSNEDDQERRRAVAAAALLALQELGDLGYLKPTPTLLELTWRDCERLVRQGRAIGTVMDELRWHWQSRPDVSLSSVLKTEQRHVVQRLAGVLAAAGLHDLDGEP